MCFTLWSAQGPRTAACRANTWIYCLTSKKGQSEVVWRRCRRREKGKGEHRGKEGKAKGRERERRGRESRREKGMERVIGSILSVKA